eukprot:CAMPEP_0113502918 /NCGR_PEP_ID=MMETSP0014_2-20120614/33847_1 /TAXON_ID=2857 /ORGANISM="Nitzschia sp." /LENGTH=538 /DNA_ID=CAMNT_0000397811 /DNA_START=36 /DNA_END=1652 /DNA_ORIENTATION=- /assembly_acc=CAM_ASM_000159
MVRSTFLPSLPTWFLATTALTTITTTQIVSTVSYVDAAIPFRSDNRQLVVLAGPHKTSETSVEEFFYAFARGDNPEFQKESALEGWSWPQVLGFGSPHKAYDQLVSSTDEETKSKILDVLRKNKDKASKGFVIGGSEFDRVGHTEWSDRDAIDAVARVQEALDIPNVDDVTIVVMYQRPRVEQWLSIVSEEASQWEQQNENKQFDDSYEAFICDRDTEDERRESIATAMNPFGVAKWYTDTGYHVVMIDLDAVRKQGLDTEHVIGCEVLGVSCTDGFITGLSEESFEANSEKHDVLAQGFTDLVEEDIINMEKLFRFRDCFYRDARDDSLLHFALESSIFEGCPEEELEFFSGEEMENNRLLFNALQSQKRCSPSPVSVEDIAKQESMEVEIDNIERYIGSPRGDTSATTTTTTTIDSSGGSTEPSSQTTAGSSTPETGGSDTSSSNNSGELDSSTPSVEVIPDPSSSSSTTVADAEGSTRPSWFLPALFAALAVVGAGLVMNLGYKERVRTRLDGEEMDGIIASIDEDPNRNLRDIM